MNATTIEWTEKTWNPITGCTPISPGCAHCYAKRMAQRLRGRCGYPADEPFRVTWHPERLVEVTPRQKPRVIFVGSMTDMFHPSVLPEWQALIMQRMGLCKQHRFLVLTKRPELAPPSWHRYFALPNVGLGVTVESPDYLWRIDELMNVEAAMHFISCEPLLGPILFDDDWWESANCPDWVIVGGETGPGARPMHPDWVHGIEEQCIEAHVPMFFKSWGDWIPFMECTEPDDVLARKPSYRFEDGNVSYRVGKQSAGRLLDGREWNELPAFLGTPCAKPS